MALIKYSLCYILLFLGESLSQNIHQVNRTGKTEVFKIYTNHKNYVSYIDLLIEDYVNQEWEIEESTCFKKTLDIMNNVKNSTLWAMWIWEAMQSPVGLLYGSKNNLGNFDECLKAPWLETHPEHRTQYCLADVNLSDNDTSYIPIDPHSPTEKYINTKSKYLSNFNTFTWGVCVPAECEPKSISKFVRSLLRNSYLGSTISRSEIKVDSCQEAGSSVQFSTGFYAVVLFLMSLVIATIFCTVLYDDKYKNGNRLVKAFCMKTNMSSLNKSFEGDIKAMHGLKFVSSGIIVLFHVALVTVGSRTSNTMEFEKDMDRYNLKAFFHSEVMVDTFLMMSGLLLMKSFMESGKMNPIIAIVKRYIRLMLLMGLIIVFIKYIIRHSGDGPLWPRMIEEEIQICYKNWWVPFLMLGNYVDTTNICYPVLWSVPCDFHLSVIGIILIMLFKKNRRLGIITFLILSAASIILPGIVTYREQLAGVPILNVEAIINYRYFLLGNPTYVFSHLRAGPYFIGIAAGYLLAIYNPSDRKNISKFWSTTGFVVAVSVAMKVLTTTAYFYSKSPTHNAWEDALFASFNRSIFALAMVFIIVFCEYGTVPVMGPLLKWWFFIPLSKLSYGLYLLHSMVFTYTKAITRSTMHYDIIYMFASSLWLIAISYVVSFLLHIFYEAPITKITNMIIDKHFTRKSSNGIVRPSEHENGTILQNSENKNKTA